MTGWTAQQLVSLLALGAERDLDDQAEVLASCIDWEQRHYWEVQPLTKKDKQNLQVRVKHYKGKVVKFSNSVFRDSSGAVARYVNGVLKAHHIHEMEKLREEDNKKPA